MQAKHARKPSQTVTEEEDDLPEDIDAFRMALARKIWRFIGDHKRNWRSCSERMCRRAHACQAPKGRCNAAGKPKREVTPQQHARSMARLNRMLAERARQDEAEDAARLAAKTHKKS